MKGSGEVVILPVTLLSMTDLVVGQSLSQEASSMKGCTDLDRLGNSTPTAMRTKS